MVLSNLKTLKDEMAEQHWTICSFIFSYKSIEYIVLVKRFVGEEKRTNDYALVKIHFMKRQNLQDELECEANSKGLIIDAKTLREYFQIEWANNLGDILSQFSKQFGEAIPKSIPINVTSIEKEAMIQSLSRSDSEDPSKIYCFGVRRNPNNGKRSEFNSDKTRLLRPNLFTYFSNDSTISFCYSDDQTRERDDATILSDFSK